MAAQRIYRGRCLSDRMAGFGSDLKAAQDWKVHYDKFYSTDCGTHRIEQSDDDGKTWQPLEES